jgi:hypothetical protein
MITQMNDQRICFTACTEHEVNQGMCSCFNRTKHSSTHIKMKEDLDIVNIALNYASDYKSEDSNVNPEGYSERQIGMLHGFIDGFTKAKETLYTKDDLLALFRAGNSFLNNDNLDFKEAFDTAVESLRQTGDNEQGKK